jgi:hypothetical protein
MEGGKATLDYKLGSSERLEVSNTFYGDAVGLGRKAAWLVWSTVGSLNLVPIFDCKRL